MRHRSEGSTGRGKEDGQEIERDNEKGRSGGEGKGV